MTMRRAVTSDEWNKLVKKLGQLRALARSASGDAATGSLDEARNAALALCGLLDRHELQIMPGDAIVYPTIEAVSETAAANAADAADAAEIRERMARAKAKPSGAGGDRVGNSDPRYGERKSARRSPESAKSTADDFPDRATIAAERIRRGIVVLESKYRGDCLHCEKPYIRGEKIYWKRDKGAWHPRCWIEGTFGKTPPTPPPVEPSIEDDDFDGLHSIWGGSPMKGGRRR